MPAAERKLVLTKTMVLETNYACNLRCIHCYVPEGSKREARFIDRDLVESLFDQFAANGFNYVLLTGGEPLLHPDFDAIYESAWDRGFYVSLFSNGLLLNGKRLELLTRKPPAVIRISLFGGLKESYSAVAGRDGFEAVRQRIIQLHEKGLPIRVKIPLLRQNAGDAAATHADLRARGIRCKIDARIIPRFNHDTDVLRWRLRPEEVLDLELENTAVNLKKYRQLKLQPPSGVRTLRYCLERCQPFVINPEGHMQLCFFIRDWSADLRRYSLRDAISHLIAAISAADLDDSSPTCERCAWQHFCTYCPGWARNEIGRTGEPIPFLCRMAEVFTAKYERLDAEAAAINEAR